MPEKKFSSEPTPPPGLSPDQLADWWRQNGGGMNNVETLANLERICPYCDSLQPCTGTNECTVCGHSLKRAKRVKSGFFTPHQ